MSVDGTGARGTQRETHEGKTVVNRCERKARSGDAAILNSGNQEQPKADYGPNSAADVVQIERKKKHDATSPFKGHKINIKDCGLNSAADMVQTKHKKKHDAASPFEGPNK